MGRRDEKAAAERGRSSKRASHDPAPSLSEPEENESPVEERRSRSRSKGHRPRRRKQESDGDRDRDRRRRRRESDEDRRRRRRRKKESRSRKRRDETSSETEEPTESEDDDRQERPREVLRRTLREFPDVAEELNQLLQMIDKGEGVDISEVPNKTLKKNLKTLFRSLKLKQNKSGVYLLPPNGTPTHEVVGTVLVKSLDSTNKKEQRSVLPSEEALPDSPSARLHGDNSSAPMQNDNGEQQASPPHNRRIIGPAMPSRELLAAAAEMTDALRDAELEVDDGLLIGPAPPAIVADAESANEAEQFEEVTRILGADAGSPYDVLGANWKMSSDNIKKRYWKLSLMVHPDKCSHPEAHQAFVVLNKAFKELQDPEKRGAIDQKLKEKEEREQFEIELRSLREAAQWRKVQGVSLVGDDELLAAPTEAPKRDEWMTTLPPERKAGVTMQSTTFSRSGKEGRGDTSVWTDSPLERVQKAKQSYLEAYDKAKAIAEAEDEKKMSAEAVLVDKYNSAKRTKSLVEKHQEQRKERKKQAQPEREEWEGNHPWKPWDREKDLAAGRQKVNIDPQSMAKGLNSRFAAGPTQRSFL